MAYTYTWDITDPQGSDFVSDGARVIREDVKAALNERLLTVFANMTDQPLKYIDLQFSADDTYAIGTTAVKPKVIYTHALGVAVATEPGEGNILVANAKAIQSRNAADNANLDLVSMSAANVMQLYGGAATLTNAGVLAATTFDGDLSGNADTATATPAANLTGNTLAAGVLHSSLTEVGVLTVGTWHATAIDEARGGTNQTTYAAGDILYASAINTLSKLAAGTNGDVLTLAGGLPSWAAPAVSNPRGETAAIGNGGTADLTPPAGASLCLIQQATVAPQRHTSALVMCIPNPDSNRFTVVQDSTGGLWTVTDSGTGDLRITNVSLGAGAQFQWGFIEYADAI